MFRQSRSRYQSAKSMNAINRSLDLLKYRRESKTIPDIVAFRIDQETRAYGVRNIIHL